jgi:hypothetical protein
MHRMRSGVAGLSLMSCPLRGLLRRIGLDCAKLPTTLRSHRRVGTLLMRSDLTALAQSRQALL